MRKRPFLLHTRLLFWADGMTIAPWLVLVHPRARGDRGLIAHESVHCEQMRRTGTVKFWLLYLLSRRFRLACEVEAYRESLRHHEGGLRYFARHLAEGYFLGITADEAERLLINGV
ncbi:hypothetical protein [Ramlibacter albus]|uniref:DUF4157 domain-containing protein n=1 Tax=Ramlibacter albus TaxID=2079448 RepID=A0A923S3H5_9BURK|nr:hypothetical protein [Ramlibacter albus]MBC5766564.1 hypothetical protein [Ramlibacter albus]